MAHLLKDKKGSRRFYDILAHVSEINITNRWIDQLGNINDKDGNCITLQFMILMR